jgi:diguanylate cyclase (GGDEF)-like protein
VPQQAVNGALGDIRRARWVAALLLAVAAASAWADAEFQRDLERASAINVTGSVAETRAALDALAPRLDSATPVQQAKYKLLLARNLVLSGRSEESERVLDEVLAQPPSTAVAIRGYGLAANIAMLSRRWERAFDLLAKGLALEPDLDDPEGMVTLLTVASYIHAQAGQPEQALEYARRSLEFAERTGSGRNRCLGHHRVAYAFKRAGTNDEAERAYRLAIGECEAAHDPILKGVAQSGLADLLRQAGQLDQADALFAEAISSLEASGYAIGVDEARFFEARLRFAQDRDAEAQRILLDLLPRLGEHAHLDYLAEGQEMLAKIAIRRGRSAEAAERLAEALATRERHLDRERAMRLAFLGVEFDLQLKEQELALLREQARVAGLEREAQRQQLRQQLLVGAVAVLVALVLALLLAQARRERGRLVAQARHDGLTALDNHTWFFERTRRSLEAAAHDKVPLTLVLADIDYFKQVNDQHGHPAGDQVLRRVAQELVAAFGDRAHLGRVGGEEFAIALRGVPAHEAVVLLQQFRRRLEEARPGPDGSPLTMSYGLASRRPGDTVETLRARADEALYRAKQAGRDRLVVADDPQAKAPVT